MRNYKYLLLVSTCVLFNNNSLASGLDLTFNSSSLPYGINTTLHTRTHTPNVELKPISNFVKLAAVCSLGSGGCDDISFNLDNSDQCKDEGYIDINIGYYQESCDKEIWGGYSVIQNKWIDKPATNKFIDMEVDELISLYFQNIIECENFIYQFKPQNGKYKIEDVEKMIQFYIDLIGTCASNDIKRFLAKKLMAASGYILYLRDKIRNIHIDSIVP